jgi:hypothetical protein
MSCACARSAASVINSTEYVQIRKINKLYNKPIIFKTCRNTLTKELHFWNLMPIDIVCSRIGAPPHTGNNDEHRNISEKWCFPTRNVNLRRCQNKNQYKKDQVTGSACEEISIEVRISVVRSETTHTSVLDDGYSFSVHLVQSLAERSVEATTAYKILSHQLVITYNAIEERPTYTELCKVLLLMSRLPPISHKTVPQLWHLLSSTL